MANILTLQLDPSSQAHFQHLRQLHFPPELNLVPAHVTLFHALPDTPLATELIDRISRAQSLFPMEISGLRSLGKGVAYTLRSPVLLGLHRQLAEGFHESLTAQDKQPYAPHIVVQNKTTPEAARSLLAELRKSFQPMQVQAHGLDLWRYLAGPWQHLRRFPFST